MAHLKEKLHRYVDNMGEYELRLLVTLYEKLFRSEEVRHGKS